MRAVFSNAEIVPIQKPSLCSLFENNDGSYNLPVLAVAGSALSRSAQLIKVAHHFDVHGVFMSTGNDHVQERSRCTTVLYN